MIQSRSSEQHNKVQLIRHPVHKFEINPSSCFLLGFYKQKCINQSKCTATTIGLISLQHSWLRNPKMHLHPIDPLNTISDSSWNLQIRVKIIPSTILSDRLPKWNGKIFNRSLKNQSVSLCKIGGVRPFPYIWFFSCLCWSLL